MTSSAQDWLDALTVGEIVAGAGVAAGVWATVRKAWPFIRRVTHFLDDLMGEPGRDGVPARPGVMSRLAAHEEKIARIEHEVTPNHGGSLKDAVNRMEKAQAEDRLVRQSIKESGENMAFVLNAHVREAISIEEKLQGQIDAAIARGREQLKAVIPEGIDRIEKLEKEVFGDPDDAC